MLHREQHLDHADDASCTHSVTDRCLDGAEGADARLVRAPTEDARQRLDLDRIAEARPSSMRLNIADARGLHPSAAIDLLQKVGLGHSAWRGDTIGPAILVGSRAFDDAPDVVLVGNGPVEGLQDQRSRCLARYEAIGISIEGPALTATGEHAGARGGLHKCRGGQHADAAGNSHVGGSAVQGVAGQMNSGKRRGARGVDGEAGTTQVQKIGNASGEYRIAVAHEGKPVWLRTSLHKVTGKVARAGTHKDSYLAAREVALRISGILQRRPRHFEEQQLLRIHDLGLAPRDAEEAMIETRNIIQPAAGVSCLAPAAQWPGAHRRARLRQHHPEGIKPVGPREASRHADDRDGAIARLELPFFGGPAEQSLGALCGEFAIGHSAQQLLCHACRLQGYT